MNRPECTVVAGSEQTRITGMYGRENYSCIISILCAVRFCEQPPAAALPELDVAAGKRQALPRCNHQKIRGNGCQQMAAKLARKKGRSQQPPTPLSGIASHKANDGLGYGENTIGRKERGGNATGSSRSGTSPVSALDATQCCRASQEIRPINYEDGQQALLCGRRLRNIMIANTPRH